MKKRKKKDVDVVVGLLLLIIFFPLPRGGRGLVRDVLVSAAMNARNSFQPRMDGRMSYPSALRLLLHPLE